MRALNDANMVFDGQPIKATNPRLSWCPSRDQLSQQGSATAALARVDQDPLAAPARLEGLAFQFPPCGDMLAKSTDSWQACARGGAGHGGFTGLDWHGLMKAERPSHFATQTSKMFVGCWPAGDVAINFRL